MSGTSSKRAADAGPAVKDPVQARAATTTSKAETVRAGAVGTWLGGVTPGVLAAGASGAGAETGLLSRADRATRSSLLLGMQGSVGNAAVQRALAGVASRPVAVRSRALRPRTVTVQREGPQQVDHDEALIKAMQLANKNSMLKLKVPVKPPASVKLWKGLELKKIELELDATAELSNPALSNKKADTKVSAGKQATSSMEVDPKKGSLTDAQATVYAIELQERFGSWAPESLRNAVTWKAGAEYGEYRPESALKPSKAEVQGRVALGLDTSLVSGEFRFTPVAYDRTKQGADAFKLLTVQVKIGTGKFLETSFPAAILAGSKPFDLKCRIKISGSVEIGPSTNEVLSVLGKLLPKKEAASLVKAAAPEIAKEETRRFTQQYARELAADCVKDIADPKARKVAEEIAERKILQEIEARQLQHLMADQTANIIERRVLLEVAEKNAPLDVVAIRAMAQKEAAIAGKAALGELGPALRLMAREAVERLSVRSVATSAAKSLAGGPADFVLIGVQILYNYVDTMMKDIDMKELGLRTLACRDNYVAGYTQGLRGLAGGSASAGGPGGGGGGGGGGNLEGTAMMLGLQEGGQQFNSVVDVHSKNVPGIDRNEAVKDIAEILKDLPINRADIIAKAAPKLQEMMLASYEKEYSGGVLRWLFGSDFKDSKDYQNFKRMIEGYLKPEASNMIRTRLKRKGVDKEVYITLVSLDSTSDRARKFRTEDGRYFVTLSGDTENYSGWVTDEGKPLEDIYLDQAIADETADPEREKERLAKLKKQLAGGALRISAKYNGLGYAFPQASLTNVPAGDLQFQEFLRSPEALSMTVDEAGLSAHVTATQRFDKEVTDYDSTFEVLFVARRGHDGTTIEVWNNGGHPQAVAGDWFARAGADLNRDLGARRLAALPKLL